jgi:CBS domain-containing protein
MREVDCGLIPIVDHKRELAGVVTDRDIVIRGLSAGNDFSGLKAEDVMSPEVHSVSDDTALDQVMKMMGDWKVRRVPVVDQSQRLVGMISMSDLAMRADCGPSLTDALEKISVPPGSKM